MNPEQQRGNPVAESHAPPPSERGDDGLAPIRGAALPDIETIEAAAAELDQVADALRPWCRDDHDRIVVLAAALRAIAAGMRNA